MDRSTVALIAAITLVGVASSNHGVWRWIPLLGAGAAFICFGYEMGYRSGKDKAMRENCNDLARDEK